MGPPGPRSRPISSARPLRSSIPATWAWTPASRRAMPWPASSWWSEPSTLTLSLSSAGVNDRSSRTTRTWMRRSTLEATGRRIELRGW